MKRNTRLGSIVLGILVLAALLMSAMPQSPRVAAGPGTRAVADTLTSAPVTTAPILDGQGTDTAWSQATQITVTVMTGANTVGNVDVHVKSVYVGGKVYFYAHWADSQDSKDRFPWFYNTTSLKWEQRGDQTTGNENTWYEDKLAMIWDIGGSIANFNTDGPTVTCHSPRHYTNGATESADMWHWKRVRTEPVGQIDDQYMDNNQTAPEAGRHSDPKTGGGYSNNNQTLEYVDSVGEFANVPRAWVPGAASGSDDRSWIKKSDLGFRAYNFTTVWKSNGTLMDEKGNVADNTMTMPGIQVSPITGDRGNISSRASWASGNWTLEYSRSLVTGSQYDVQFSSIGVAATYYFGLGTFNNAQIDHNVHYGSVYAFKFGQPNQNPTTPQITYTPVSPKAGETITFAAVSSTDPDGDTLTYAWTFGDGGSGTGAAPTHSYSAASTYTVTVVVNDGHGGTATNSTSVTVAEKPAAAGLSTEMIIVIVIVIIAIVAIIGIALSRRKKPAPPVEPPPTEP